MGYCQVTAKMSNPYHPTNTQKILLAIKDDFV